MPKETINLSYKIQIGDCAWKVAKRNLSLDGQKPTNADIVKEMDRLAQINGYDSVSKFNSAKFSNLGNSIKTKSDSIQAIEEAPTDNMTISTNNLKQVLPQPSKLVKTSFGGLATEPKVANLRLLSQEVRDYNTKNNAPQPIITIKNTSKLAKAVVSQDNHLTYL